MNHKIPRRFFGFFRLGNSGLGLEKVQKNAAGRSTAPAVVDSHSASLFDLLALLEELDRELLSGNGNGLGD